MTLTLDAWVHAPQSFHDLLPHTVSGTDHIATFHHEQHADDGHLSSLLGHMHLHSNLVPLNHDADTAIAHKCVRRP